MRIWRNVEHYEGLYQVNDQGEVRSVERIVECSNGRRMTIRSRILKDTDDGAGYRLVGLSKGGKHKTIRVHRLVATAFIDNPENAPEVDHANRNKTDNRACNLRWCTREQQMYYARKEQGGIDDLRGQNHGRAKLSDDQAVSIIYYLLDTSDSYSKIAEEFDVSKSAIQMINEGSNWKHILPDVVRPIRKR